MGLIEAVVAERRSALGATGAGTKREPGATRHRSHGRAGHHVRGRRRAPVRVAGRVLVAAGLRLAGPEALHGRTLAWVAASEPSGGDR